MERNRETKTEREQELISLWTGQITPSPWLLCNATGYLLELLELDVVALGQEGSPNCATGWDAQAWLPHMMLGGSCQLPEYEVALTSRVLWELAMLVQGRLPQSVVTVR